MKNFCVLTPAIIDEECVRETSKSLIKNLYNINPDVNFIHIVQLCNYKRPYCDGDLETIKAIYETENNIKNCEVKVNVSMNRLGHTLAGYKLFEEFINSAADLSLVIEDDTKLMHPLKLDLIYSKVENDDNSIFHLAMGYEKLSSENPFITKEILDDYDNFFICKNNRNFCSWNGTFFTKKIINNILNDFDKDSTANCEDQISKMSCWYDKEIKTICFKSDLFNVIGLPEPNENRQSWQCVPWRLNRDSHFVLEVFRRTRPGHQSGGQY